MDESPAVAPPPPRILPHLTAFNQAYWTGGASGRLLIQRCATCRRWAHPPAARCPACAGDLAAEAVSGRGTVFTFTVNFHQYHPTVPPPYTIGIVELDEQTNLRVTTNLVNVGPDALRCGMPVQVLFEVHGDFFVPVFEPAIT